MQTVQNSWPSLYRNNDLVVIQDRPHNLFWEVLCRNHFLSTEIHPSHTEGSAHLLMDERGSRKTFVAAPLCTVESISWTHANSLLWCRGWWVGVTGWNWHLLWLHNFTWGQRQRGGGHSSDLEAGPQLIHKPVACRWKHIIPLWQL